MGVFINGWPRRRVSPHVVSVPVTPAVPIVSSSVANPTVLTTSTPHGLVTGDTVAIAGHVGSTPAVDGSRVVTVLTPTTFSVPVAVTFAGAGGTATRTAAVPVIALAEAKLHTRIGADVTLEDSLIAAWTRAAQAQVENETGLKLLTQTYDLVLDAFPEGAQPLVLPFGPLQAVLGVTSYDSADTPVLQTMDAASYVVDTAGIPGRIGLAATATWPTDLREFQPVIIRVIVGYASIAAIPEPLLQAIRLALAWHSANREPTAIETQSYDWLIGPHRAVVVA